MSQNQALHDDWGRFYRISRIFTLTLDVDEMLRRMMAEVVPATGAQRGFLLLRDGRGGLSVRAAHSPGASEIDVDDANYSARVVERVIAEGRAVLISNAQEEAWLRASDSAVPHGLRPHRPAQGPLGSPEAASPEGPKETGSILCVPMLFHNATLGAIYVDHRMDRGAFTLDHLQLLTALSQHAAIAIENARLLRGMHERLAGLRLLHEISADLSGTLDLQRVLTACLERVQGVLSTQAASILTVEKDELVFQVAIGEKAGELKPFRIPLTQGIAGWVARNAKGTFSNDAYGDARFYGNVDRRSGFVTQMVMAAPLIVQNRVTGVIEVFNKPGGFDDADLELLSTIAASAAIAIENARLYQVAVEKGRLEQELSVARGVQANLIPRSTPTVAGWDFAGHWHSALEVSGDFYDFVGDELGRPGVVIADVADKGMAAALFMALARSIVRASVGQGRSPAESIAHANRLICADAADGMFVTLCYAQLYPESGELAYVNAGHPAPVHYRATAGELLELTQHSAPLGIDDTMRFDCRSTQLEPGDFVFLYTDGVTDALNETGEDFGKARLLRTVAASRSDSARAVCDSVREALTQFIGLAPAADDATFVVVQRQA